MKFSIFALLVMSSIVINENASSVQPSGEKNTDGIASLGGQGETHRGGYHRGVGQYHLAEWRFCSNDNKIRNNNN
ncbi:hypothetical protein [Rahnella laticis]|uniref:hypothetical protein n=1 Tax=Rahnella laticis TaxID=2787622 RepID=UPI0018A2F757|nr:hypothetical protein [Rahnella laticis]MBF7997772.1 hypothetical protein [Rahnella laticis]